MNRTATWACVLAAVTAQALRAEQPTKTEGKADADLNVYEIDPIRMDIFDHWRTIGRTKMHFLIWSAFEPGRRMIELWIEPSKAGQMVHGVERRGLKLPLPKAVRFRVWTNVTYLWVVLGDRQGRRVSSQIPLAGLRPCQWCDIELPLDRTVPMGVGAERIGELNLIAFLTRESAGEHEETTIRMCFSKLEAVYPKGVGPTNPTFTKQDLAKMLEPLPDMIDQVDRLMTQARDKGIDVRYPAVSQAVLHRYRGEVNAMYRDKDPFIAKRTARFLLECAERTKRELQETIEHPDQAIRVPDVPLKSLRCREGTFHSGDRPVILAGVCGWFGPGYFKQLSAMGYTALSIEIGPRSTLPSENETKPEGVNSIKAVLDAATQHNVVCDLLVSPHYFPDWARKKWPGTDATGWRQKTNPFMPWTITDPHFREVIAKHLSVLIPRVREHPALLSYDLINEAWYRLIPDFPAKQWAAFRKANVRSGRRRAAGRTGNQRMDEWQALSRMGTENVTEFLRWYIGELHKHDKVHPVHIKAIDTVDVLSVDREAVGEVLTANGMDAMPSWPDWTGQLGADFAWPFLRHDFHRSLQPDHPILDGEYHISSGPFSIPANYFVAALWGLALHGRDMTACWVCDRVDDVSIYWHACGVEALGRSALDFVRLAPEIHAFQRQHGPLALYYGGTKTSDAYRACLFQDLDVAVVTDKRIRAGRLADSRVLVIPFQSGLAKDLQDRVTAFQKRGGQVVRCPAGVGVRNLWRNVHRAVERAKLPRLVRTDQWGVECRSLELGQRRLFYVLNHRRKPTDVHCKSDWPLANAVDLRTQARFDAAQFRMAPLEIRLVEVP